MRFSTRNAYYLRISATTVLPLYIYLDERHVDWMSERVLQHVLSDLRPLIIPKLNAEADARLGVGGPANAKRGTLDVHRGDTYQFGYFLRGTEPHAVLIKSRLFTAAPPVKRAPAQAVGSSNSTDASTKKKTGKAAQKSTRRQKPKPKPRPRGKGKARALDNEEPIAVSSEEEGEVEVSPAESLASRRPKRTRAVAAGGYREQDEDEDMPAAQFPDDVMDADQPHALSPDTPVVPKSEEVEPSLSEIPHRDPSEDVPLEKDIGPVPSAMDVELIDEDEEPKPKPILNLRYHGFTIHGRCLCVIVEPWPPLRSATRALSLAPMGVVAPRAPSIAPPDFVPSGGPAQRERTPLFLPDLDREPTPAPSIPARRVLPPVPLFSENAEETGSDDEGDMVLFSQIIRSVGDHPPGIADDEDEIDGAVFFGDADETREL